MNCGNLPLWAFGSFLISRSFIGTLVAHSVPFAHRILFAALGGSWSFAKATLSVRLLLKAKSHTVVDMCGRFTLKSPGRIKFDRVDRSNLPPLFPRYNIAPSQSVLALVRRAGEREAAFLQWASFRPGAKTERDSSMRAPKQSRISRASVIRFNDGDA
jgi:hypothetical protein